MRMRCALVVLAGLLLCGCSLTAQKPPTPAAQITARYLTALPQPECERYFLIFFGSEDRLRRPQYTHTWATLVRIRAPDAGPGGVATPGCLDPALDVQTISWLPVKGCIDARSRAVEPGRNYELHETMRFALGTNQSVAYWGPYEVWHGFAHRFTVQKQFLDSGAIGYQCIDSWGEAARLGNGSDCIHAVTDMDPVYPRWGYPLAYYGKAGTARVVRRFMHSPIWYDPELTHDWLMPRLGMCAYPLEKRRYVGRAEEHDPNSPEGLDAKAPPVLPVAPKSAPGIERTKVTGKPPSSP
jgi:hypothetical protein